MKKPWEGSLREVTELGTESSDREEGQGVLICGW